MVDKLTDASEPLSIAADKPTDASEPLSIAVDKPTDASESLLIAIDKPTDASESLSIAIDKLTDASESLSIAVVKLTNASEPLSIGIDKLTDASESLSIAIDKLTVASEPLSIAVDQLTDASEPLSIAVDQPTVSSAKRNEGTFDHPDHLVEGMVTPAPNVVIGANERAAVLAAIAAYATATFQLGVSIMTEEFLRSSLNPSRRSFRRATTGSSWTPTTSRNLCAASTVFSPTASWPPGSASGRDRRCSTTSARGHSSSARARAYGKIAQRTMATDSAQQDTSPRIWAPSP